MRNTSVIGCALAAVVGLVVILALAGVMTTREPSRSARPARDTRPSPTVSLPAVNEVASSSPEATPPASSVDLRAEVSGSLAELLAELVVTPEHRDGYDRDLFPVWTDDDGDGCNTRNEVLIAKAIEPPAVSGSCDLTGGSWLSPYDGVVIHDSAAVQIDHVVALAEAWYSGAFGWTTERRQAFANDLRVPWELATASPEINEAKGSSDPASWIPSQRSAVCPYLEAWIGVKVRWRLTVDAAEQRALADLIKSCPSTDIVVPFATPAP